MSATHLLLRVVRGMEGLKDMEFASTAAEQYVVKVLCIIETHQDLLPASLAVSRSVGEPECHEHKQFA